MTDTEGAGEPLIGYRVWFGEEPGYNPDDQPRKPKLRSIGPDFDWTHGAVTAGCNGPAEATFKHVLQGDAPLAGCGCGIYAYDRLQTAQQLHGSYGEGLRQHMVLGAVQLWGRIIIEDVPSYAFLDGQNVGLLYRAEHARVLVLRSEDRVAQRVAEAFGIPLVSERWLQAKAGEYGGHLKPEVQGA
jgi:hypothetical protein